MNINICNVIDIAIFCAFFFLWGRGGRGLDFFMHLKLRGDESCHFEVLSIIGVVIDYFNYQHIITINIVIIIIIIAIPL